MLDRDDAVTLNDLAQKAPTLQVSAANARQTSFALRGLGKNSANEAIQSSVGLIVVGNGSRRTIGEGLRGQYVRR